MQLSMSIPPAASAEAALAGHALRLVASDGGWSLATSDGHVVFGAAGTDARRRCLEVAEREGVLVLLS